MGQKRKSVMTKTEASSTCVESVKKGRKAEDTSRLSFGQNQKLNFIFGTNLQQKPIPFQDVLKAQQEPVPPLAIPLGGLKSSEIDTPRLNILPTIRTVNVELEKPAEETYEEIDMRTESSGRSENEEPADTGDLYEMKRRLNEMAQQVRCVDEYEVKEEESPAKELPHPVKSEEVRKTKKEDTMMRTHEIVDRAIRRLTECKSGLRLFSDFVREMQRIDNDPELSERDRLLRLKMSMAHVCQQAQMLPLKAIDDDLEFLKNSVIAQDKESVATTATAAETPKCSFDIQKFPNKYQTQAGKLRLENSVLQKQLTELELALTAIQRPGEPLFVPLPKSKQSAEVQTVPDDTAITRVRGILVAFSVANKASKAGQREQLGSMSQTISELQTTAQSLRTSLAQKEAELSQAQEEIGSLKKLLESTLLVSQAENAVQTESATTALAHSVAEVSCEPTIISGKIARQMSALSSIMICKSESIAKELQMAEHKANAETKKKKSRGDARARVHQECLKRLLSLKAAARNMFNALLRSARVTTRGGYFGRTERRWARRSARYSAAGSRKMRGTQRCKMNCSDVWMSPRAAWRQDSRRPHKRCSGVPNVLAHYLLYISIIKITPTLLSALRTDAHLI